MAFKRPYAERSHQDSVSNPHSVTYTQVGAASTAHEHIEETSNPSPGYLVMTPTNDETPYKSLIEVYNVNINLPSGGAYLINGDEHTHSMLYDNNTGYVVLEVGNAYADGEAYLGISGGASGGPDPTLKVYGTSSDINIDIVPKGTGKVLYDGTEISTVDHNHDVDYLGLTATASNSLLLEGASAAEFATSDHNHDSVYATVGHTHTGMVTFSTGDGIPTSTPASIGIQYIDITNKHVYVAVGTGSSSDWIQTG